MPDGVTMTRCCRCVLPECTPGILFKDGLCSDCRDHKPIVYEGEEKLLRILEGHRGGCAQRYDCLVGLSGGRDSSYALLKLAGDYGMRVLAVNYRNPFTEPRAEENIQNVVRALGVDLIRFELPHRIHERTFRDLTAAWLRDPSPALVPIICIACKTMHASMIRIAKQHGIRCIINGGNRFEDVSFKKRLIGVDASVRAERAVTSALCGLMKESWRRRSYFKPYMLPMLMKGYLFADPYTLGSRILGHGMTQIDLFHFVEWDETTMLARLRSELGWDQPADTPSSWRFDCRVGQLKSWMYMTTLGLTERDDLYSRMIRNGALSREVALRRLERENARDTDQVAAFLHEHGIDSALLATVKPRTEARLSVG